MINLMFKKKTRSNDNKKYVGLDEQSLMFLRARHEWDERIGNAIYDAHSWKMAFFISLMVSIGSVIGISYIGSQSKIQPFAIAISNDKAQALSPLNKLPETEKQRLYVRDLSDFISDMRSVFIDTQAQKIAITNGYAMLREGDPAYNQITSLFKVNNPFKRAESELVKVNVESVLPISPNTYQAEWIEETTDLKGKIIAKKRYKATMNIYFIQPTSQEAILRNPLGLYIKTFNDVEL